MKGWLEFEFHPELVTQIAFNYSEVFKLVFALQPELAATQAKCIVRLIISTSGAGNPSMEPVRIAVGTRVIALSQTVDALLESKCHRTIQALQEILSIFGKVFLPKLVANMDMEWNKAVVKLLTYKGKKTKLVCEFLADYFKQVKDRLAAGASNKDIDELLSGVLVLVTSLSRLPKRVFNEFNEEDETFKKTMNRRKHYGKVISSVGLCLSIKCSWEILRQSLDIECKPATSNDTNYLIMLEALLFALHYLLLCTFIVHA